MADLTIKVTMEEVLDRLPIVVEYIEALEEAVKDLSEPIDTQGTSCFPDKVTDLFYLEAVKEEFYKEYGD